MGRNAPFPQAFRKAVAEGLTNAELYNLFPDRNQISMRVTAGKLRRSLGLARRHVYIPIAKTAMSYFESEAAGRGVPTRALICRVLEAVAKDDGLIDAVLDDPRLQKKTGA